MPSDIIITLCFNFFLYPAPIQYWMPNGSNGDIRINGVREETGRPVGLTSGYSMVQFAVIHMEGGVEARRTFSSVFDEKFRVQLSSKEGC